MNLLIYEVKNRLFLNFNTSIASARVSRVLI